MMFYWGLTIGLFVGCFVGMTIMGLCHAAKHGDDEEMSEESG